MTDHNIQSETSNTKRFSFYENFDGHYHKVGEIRELLPQFKAFYYAEKSKDQQRSAIKIINDFNKQIRPLTFFPWEKQYRLWRKKWDAELLAKNGYKQQQREMRQIIQLQDDKNTVIVPDEYALEVSEKINAGIYPWKPPLGYISGNFKKRGLKKTEADKPDPARLPIIKKLFRVCLEERISSSTELSKIANQLGLTTKSEKKIYPQKIDEIFENKFYAGLIDNPFTDENDIRGKHERVVSPDEFKQIQLIRKGKIQVVVAKRLKSNPDFPLTRDVKCAICNLGLSGSKNRGNGGVYENYHCHNRKKDDAGIVTWKCSMYGRSISRKKLHQDFIAWLQTVTPKQEFLDLFEAVVIDVWRNNASLLENTIKRQETEIQELKQRKMDYVEMIRKGTISEDFGKEMIERVDNEIAVKQLTMRENTIDKLDIEAAVAYATNFISDLPRTWMDLEIETKKRFQKLILPEGITYSKESGFGTAKLGLIYELNRKFDGQKSDLVDPSGFEPLTSSLQMRRSTGLSYGPLVLAVYKR